MTAAPAGSRSNDHQRAGEVTRMEKLMIAYELKVQRSLSLQPELMSRVRRLAF
jgi:hypothetical protein